MKEADFRGHATIISWQWTRESMFKFVTVFCFVAMKGKETQRKIV